MSTRPTRPRRPAGRISTPGRRIVLATALAVVAGQLLHGAQPGDAAPPNTVTSVNAASTTGATTSTAFTAGVGYRILATGTYSVAAPTGGVLPGTVPPVTTGDANCFGGQPDASRELQVWAAGQRLAVLWRSWASSQPCDPSNVYYFDYVGTGVPLTFVVGTATGNSGVLIVYSWPANPANGTACVTMPPPGTLMESDLHEQS